MIKPRYWFNDWRTRRAIVDYPLYDVPNKQAEGTLPRDKIDENFAYFMSVRLERLAFFQSWLSRCFGVKAPLTGDGVLALESWAKRNSGSLIAGTGLQESARTFVSYHPSWQGDRAGYNVLVDIAIFMGEFLIARRPHLHWTLLSDDSGGLSDDSDGGPIGRTLGRPELGGFALARWTPNLLQSAFYTALSSKSLMEFEQRPYRRFYANPAELCRESLHVATHSDPTANFVFGDYRHGHI